MIYKIGLLPRHAKHLAGGGLSKFEEFSASHGWDEDATEEDGFVVDGAYLFTRQLHSRWIAIDFVGVWDTVASLIRPDPDKFLLPSSIHLKFTRRNPIVKIFRHAVAIDERRIMFPLDPWVEPQTCFMRPRDEESRRDQDIAQVWFAGVHADVGGGYKEEDSGLSKFSLVWMVEETVKAGLTINRDLYDRLAWGKNLIDIPYKAPTFALPRENMTKGWWVLEVIPKFDKYKGFYIPNAKPRQIPEGALIHESVFGCMAAIPTYCPSNFPKNYHKVGHPDPG
jgi:hypothetical protein